MTTILETDGNTQGSAMIPDGSVGPTKSAPNFHCVGKSALVNVLNPNVPYVFDFPLIAGKRLMGIIGRFVCATRTGTATGNGSYSIGNNASSYDNFQTITAGLSSANITAAVPGSVIALGGGNGAPDLTTNRLNVMITTAPTGVTVFTGYFVFHAVYVSL